MDIREEEKPLLMGEGRGLALPPANSAAIAQPDAAPVKPETLIVVRDNKQEPDQYEREMENIRRMKLQAQLTALSAPLGVRVASTGTMQSSPAVQAEQRREVEPRSAFDPSSLRENGYDPSADRDKEAFFTRAGRDESWILPHGRMAGQPLEIKTGAVIPAVMVTGINSDLPGTA